MMNKLGRRLKEARKKKNLTQVQLAKAVGTKQPIIQGYESGRRGHSRPDIYLVLKMARVLGLSLDDLFADEKETKKNKKLLKSFF